MEAVIFDFDGVIADSEPLHLLATREALAAVGLTLGAEEYFGRYLGYDDRTLLWELAADRGVTLTDEQRSSILRHKAERVPALLRRPGVLLEGAADCITRLAVAVPLAIASGALRHEIELVLDAADLRRHFRCIVAAGDTPRGKPAPDPYARALAGLQALGVVSREDGVESRTVAVEDSPWGIEAARAAGMRCVAVTTSCPASRLGRADLVVSSLRDVTVERLSRLAVES